MKKQNRLSEDLYQILRDTEGSQISLGALSKSLHSKGPAALLILLSIPFCQPISLAGFSTPFGLGLASLGLLMTFKQALLIPQFLKRKKLSLKTLRKITQTIHTIEKKIHWLTKTRFKAITLPTSPLYSLHGVIVIIMGLLLALPLPIPLSNFFAALPIFLLGLALLQKDGLLTLFAYFFTLIGFAYFFALIYLGKLSLELFA